MGCDAASKTVIAFLSSVNATFAKPIDDPLPATAPIMICWTRKLQSVWNAQCITLLTADTRLELHRGCKLSISTTFVFCTSRTRPMILTAEWYVETKDWKKGDW